MVQNGQLLAVFNSAHRVMKAESILKGCKLPVLLIPAPRALSADCGLAIRFSDEYNDRVMQTLAAHDLLPAFVCRRITASHFETTWNGDDKQPDFNGDNHNEQH